MRLLVGTTNSGKVLEIEEVLKGLSVELIPLVSRSPFPSVTEDGATFEENALIKARSLAQFSGLMTLADDSGLEVEALGGAPGLHSARYSGPAGTDAMNNQKLLRALAGVPQEERAARFVCVIALCDPTVPGRAEWLFRGECAGRIASAPRGSKGFGYDPLFLYPPMGKTFAELDREAKNRVSHRGQALRKLREALQSLSV